MSLRMHCRMSPPVFPPHPKHLYLERVREVHTIDMGALDVKTRWAGAAHVEVYCGPDVLLIDPYCSRPGKMEILTQPLRPRIGKIRSFLNGIGGTVRAIAVGHTHFDHSLDAPEIARFTHAAVLGSSSLATLFELSGLPGVVTVCQPHDPVDIGQSMRVTMIPSRHGRILGKFFLMEGEIDRRRRLPLRAHRYRLGSMFAVHVRTGGISILHVGSAGFKAEELESVRCDILFLCVSGWKGTPGYPQMVIDLVRPSCVVPIHHDDFTVPIGGDGGCRILRSADLDGFMKRVRAGFPGVEIRVLPPQADITITGG